MNTLNSLSNKSGAKQRIARCKHVAEKLSGLSETLAKEAPCGDGPLPLR